MNQHFVRFLIGNFNDDNVEMYGHKLVLPTS